MKIIGASHQGNALAFQSLIVFIGVYLCISVAKCFGVGQGIYSDIPCRNRGKMPWRNGRVISDIQCKSVAKCIVFICGQDAICYWLFAISCAGGAMALL